MFWHWNKYYRIRISASTLQMKGRWESNINVWFPFMYSQNWNCYFQNRIIMVCLLVPTLTYLWEIYIFPGSVCLFCGRKYVDRSWYYINRSQAHECGNWGWGRTIPRKGIQSGIFVAVYLALPPAPALLPPSCFEDVKTTRLLQLQDGAGDRYPVGGACTMHQPCDNPYSLPTKLMQKNS